MEQFIKNLAKGAGAILREGFKKEYTSRLKSEYRWDLVTNFDLAAEKFIIERIKKKYPKHGIFSEEAGHIQKNNFFWLIDPLAGTFAFSKGIDQFAVSIAFVSKGIIEYGAVCDPVRDELFFAKKKNGAYLNGKKMRAGETTDMHFAHTSIILGSGQTTYAERRQIYNNAIKFALWFGKLESLALNGAWLANGVYDILITKNLAPWDSAAAKLIMAEAGAKVTDFKGKPYRWNSDQIVAANPVLHKKAMAIVRGVV